VIDIAKVLEPKVCNESAEDKESKGDESMRVRTRRGEGEEGASRGKRGQQQKQER
jgi:hypothetical protein